jgi:putative endonuclease
MRRNPSSFTCKYNVNKLFLHERFRYINDAIAREKQIKAGSGKKKILLVESMNREWRELRIDINGHQVASSSRRRQDSPQ